MLPVLFSMVMRMPRPSNHPSLSALPWGKIRMGMRVCCENGNSGWAVKYVCVGAMSACSFLTSDRRKWPLPPILTEINFRQCMGLPVGSWFEVNHPRVGLMNGGCTFLSVRLAPRRIRRGKMAFRRWRRIPCHVVIAFWIFRFIIRIPERKNYFLPLDRR